MRTTIAIVLTFGLAPACIATTASAAPPNATMLAPGVYTTPEISARCQGYTGRRVSNSGTADTARQSVFIACVQKLYRDEYGSAAAVDPAPYAPMIEAPVSLGGLGPYGYGCSTDEGYGRRGTCDSF